MPPAARVTDMHVCPMVTGIVPHVGGPILPPGAPTVLIGFLPAATVTSMATCVGPPDLIIMGSLGVMINFLPAARMGDPTAHGGVIVLGEPTVMIGEIGAPSPGAGGAGGVAAGLVASGIALAQVANASRLALGGSQSLLGPDDPAPAAAPRPSAQIAPSTGASGPYAQYNTAMQAKATHSAMFFSGRQANKDTCGLMATNSILWEQNGNPNPPDPPPGVVSSLKTAWADRNISPATTPLEKAMIANGSSSSGYFWCNGTTDSAAVMTTAGMPSSNTDKPTLTHIASAVEDGKGVMVGLDARPIWGGRALRQPKPLGHAVRVTGVQRDDAGKISGFYINDSGSGKPGQLVPASTFQSALNGLDGGNMATTDDAPFNPILEPVIPPP